MAEMKLDLVDKLLLGLDNSIKTSEDLIRLYDIDQKKVEDCWDEMVDKGLTLLGGIFSCRIRMIKPWNWEFIVDPPVDDDFNPLWDEAKEDIELIYGGDKLMMVLYIFAAENGDPTKYLSEEWAYNGFLKKESRAF